MLTLTQLIGFGAGGAPPPELSFIGYTFNATQQTTYTFNGVAIGAADPTRRVIVAAYWGDIVSHKTITAASINGGSVLPAHVSAVGGSFNAGDVAIFSGLVPTGTTANFSFTLNASVASTKFGIGVYRAINEGVATPHAVATDITVAAGALSSTINIPASGWVIGAAGGFGDAAFNNFTWTGATEQFDQIRATGTVARASGALQASLPPQPNRPITATGNGVMSTGALAAISWG
jgi:hypothetical protein